MDEAWTMHWSIYVIWLSSLASPAPLCSMCSSDEALANDGGACRPSGRAWCARLPHRQRRRAAELGRAAVAGEPDRDAVDRVNRC
jgi:hypothetical protein